MTGYLIELAEVNAFAYCFWVNTKGLINRLFLYWHLNFKEVTKLTFELTKAKKGKWALRMYKLSYSSISAWTSLVLSFKFFFTKSRAVFKFLQKSRIRAYF